MLDVNKLQQMVDALIRMGDKSACTLLYAYHCITVYKVGPNHNPSFEIIDTLSDPTLPDSKATRWKCKNRDALIACLLAHAEHSLSKDDFSEQLKRALLRTSPIHAILHLSFMARI
jgi:hypothetical protein